MTEITFDGGDITIDEQHELDSTLRKLIDPANPSPWDRPPERIEVRHKLSGLGGATVVEVLVHRDGARWARVVKVDTAEEMRLEWQRFEAVVKPIHSDLCPPIEAATPGARDASRSHPREREAIVYDHVAQFAGEPDAPLTTLEDVFARASLGDLSAAARARAAVVTTLLRARHVFYGRVRPVKSASLEALGRTLGPDIVVEAESLGTTDGAEPRIGPAPRRIYPKQIRVAGAHPVDAAPAPGAGTPIAAGERIEVIGLRLRPDATRLRAQREGATVEIVSGPPGVPVPDPFDLVGTVRQTRPELVMERLARAVADLRVGPGVIEGPDVTAAHPFAVLDQTLHEIAPVVRSAVHGDLNSRNVLLVDSPHTHTPSDRAYLIDYARAGDAGHLLADFTWLEINLMRAVGGTPPLADLVRMQRTVTAATALFPFVDDHERPAAVPVTDADEPLAAHQRTTAPGLATIWPILLRLRWEAYRCYPFTHRADWFAAYNRYLTIAAHRTFKWPDAQQTATGWAASAAIAAVAAEWHDRATALRHWPDGDLHALVPALTPTLARAGAWAADVLGTVTAEIDRRRTATGPGMSTSDNDAALATAATAVAASALLPPPPRPARPFIDLAAVIGDGDPPVKDRVSAVTQLTREGDAILIAAAGMGKSTVVQAIADRMLAASSRLPRPDGERCRLPVVVPARDVLADGDRPIEDVVARYAPIQDRTTTLVAALLRAGCLHVFVDGVGGPDDWPDVATWTRRVRTTFPSTPVLASGRTAPPRPRDSTIVYRLLPPTVGQAVGYLTESAAVRDLPVHRVRSVLAGADTRLSAELLDSPLFLSLLAAHLMPDSPPPTVGDLLDRHLAHPPTDHDDVPPDRWAAARDMAAALAAHFVDSAANHVDDVDTSGWLDAAHHAAWPAARDLLVACDVLRPVIGGVTFARPVVRDFLAATDLPRQPELLTHRARRLAWQEPLRLAVSRRGAAADVLAAVLLELRRADPVFAGRLLAAAAPTATGAVELFLAERETALRDPRLGEAEWRRAAAALHAVGTAGEDVLRSVVGDRTVPVRSRLAGLAVLCDTAGSPPYPRELSRLIGHLLAYHAEPLDLRIAAMGYAVRAGATQLAVLIADGCVPGAPWRYRQAAHDALAALDVPLPAALHTAYRTAAADRLAELDRRLPTETVAGLIEHTQAERARLLRETFADDLDRLLAHRFAFEISQTAGDAIDRWLVASTPDLLDDAVRVLTEATAEEALRHFAAADDRGATAAAHRLLGIARGQAADLVALVHPDGSPARLLAAAAAAPACGAEALPHLRALAQALLDAPRDAARTEALAALVSAVARLDEVEGARLAHAVRVRLTAAGDPARMHWPVRPALFRHSRLRLSAALLVTGNAGDRAIGVAGLAMPAFHLDATPPPRLVLDRPSLDALRSAQPTPGATWAAVDFVRAAATARLTGALGLVHDLLGLPRLATMVRQFGYRDYGVLTLAALSEVLTAGGFLVRCALLGADRSSDGIATAVADRITALDTSGGHPSVAAGRLIALGQLGDPDPLLGHLNGADERLHVAARQAALDLAQDGPYGSTVWRDPARALDTVAHRLYRDGHSPEARTTLLEIVAGLSARTGLLPSAPGAGRSA